MSAPVRQATIADLYQCEGKAELVNGRIVEVMTGLRPNEIAANVYVSLREYARQTRAGRAFTDGMGFTVPTLSSGRESFSPDAAFHPGPFVPHSKRFVDGAPSFAVEVRSENDYGAAAEREMAEKRDDYFEAGTLVVWDVDEDAGTVTAYRFRQQSVVYRCGQVAEAEPAVPGWRIAVEDIFAEEGMP
jgi:Uma2 family endonuclease